MGRLIDEEVLMERLGFLNTPQEREENAGQIITLEDFDLIPTAFNPDKVVEQLKRDSYEETADDMNSFKPPQVVNLYDAIEIVRGGGISKEEKDEDLER